MPKYPKRERRPDELPAPAYWKAQVRAKLAGPDWSQHRLAAAIGAAQSTISQALSREHAKCRYVVEISEALGIQVPREVRIMRAMQQLAADGDLDGLDTALRYLEARAQVGRVRESAEAAVRKATRLAAKILHGDERE